MKFAALKEEVMKFAALAVSVVLLAASPVFAKEIAVKGELVDLSCYMGHGAKGEGHKKCALKCIKGGVPMGVLTDKGEIYVLLPNHDNEEPYEKAKDLAAEIVEVKGDHQAKGGLNSIIVTSVLKAGK